MSRRTFCKQVAFSPLAAALPACLGAAAETNPISKPNIIFILADDLGLGNISCCGADHFKTPRIDELAAGGTRFEYCYATPLCGPSRCQLLTGQYPFRTGLINNHSHNAVSPQRQIMMPTVLKQAGYITAQAGKWGQIALGPGEWGFDEYLVFPGSGRYWRAQTDHYIQNGQRKNLPAGQYLPELMHNFLVDFITRNREKPFYIYYAMSHIHGPIVRTPDSKPTSNLYADNIAYMDKLVGKLVDELDRLKLREKTLIIFTGDNGTAALANAPARSTVDGQPLSGHKAQMLEGGSRVPLIANWPGTTPAGQVNHNLTDFSDFFPTFAELAGAKLPDRPLDGTSIAPQLRGQPGPGRPWVYVELDGKRYIRDARYKLTGTGDLLDLKDAPFKEPSAADTPESQTARKSLQSALDKLLAGMANRAAPTASPKPNKKKAKSVG